MVDSAFWYENHLNKAESLKTTVDAYGVTVSRTVGVMTISFLGFCFFINSTLPDYKRTIGGLSSTIAWMAGAVGFFVHFPQFNSEGLDTMIQIIKEVEQRGIPFDQDTTDYFIQSCSNAPHSRVVQEVLLKYML